MYISSFWNYFKKLFSNKRKSYLIFESIFTTFTKVTKQNINNKVESQTPKRNQKAKNCFKCHEKHTVLIALILKSFSNHFGHSEHSRQIQQAFLRGRNFNRKVQEMTCCTCQRAICASVVSVGDAPALLAC